MKGTYEPLALAKRNRYLPARGNDLVTDIAIVGGGVAGLSLLAAMQRSNFGVLTLERGSGPQPRGMGFILMPNGVYALDRLFPGLDWERISTPLQEARMMLDDGSMLRTQSMIDTRCVSRQGLIEEMFRLLGDSGPLTDVAVVDIEATSDQVHALKLQDGRRVHAEAFVGCDGINSKARAWMHSGVQLETVRVRELVNVLHAPEIASVLGRSFTKFHAPEGGLAVGMVPAGEHVIWYVQHEASRFDFQGKSGEAIKAELRRALGHWPELVEQLIQQTDFETSYVWNITDLDPLPYYHRGNMLLTGDAAHPLLSFTSQGASAAIEDASLLADLLDETGDLESVSEAFAKFDSIRRPMFASWVDQGRALLERFLEPPSRAMDLPLAK